ncbi:hypothetical protein ACLOJK_026248 [Asimina triloba]
MDLCSEWSEFVAHVISHAGAKCYIGWIFSTTDITIHESCGRKDSRGPDEGAAAFGCATR